MAENIIYQIYIILFYSRDVRNNRKSAAGQNDYFKPDVYKRQIQIRQKVRMDDLLIIMHGNKAYANGLKAVLEAFPGHILCFSTWEEKRKKLGNRKPSIWIPVSYTHLGRIFK